MIAAAIYAACRITKTLRTLDEIAKASLVDRKKIARAYRILQCRLEIKLPITDPLDYISSIAKKTGISGRTQILAIKILHETKRKHLADGRTPSSLAAAALYIACLQTGEKKTQRNIAKAAGITEVTVRNRYKEIEESLA
jgi:transcription initiation factor TFIIB